MTDRYRHLTNATTVARIFLEHCATTHRIPSSLLTDNGFQFWSTFFLSVCSTVGVISITTTEYQPQINGQAERFNSTIIRRLLHYVPEHQIG